jgi:hypothetical protein
MNNFRYTQCISYDLEKERVLRTKRPIRCLSVLFHRSSATAHRVAGLPAVLAHGLVRHPLFPRHLPVRFPEVGVHAAWLVLPRHQSPQGPAAPPAAVAGKERLYLPRAAVKGHQVVRGPARPERQRQNKSSTVWGATRWYAARPARRAPSTWRMVSSMNRVSSGFRPFSASTRAKMLRLGLRSCTRCE